MNPIQSPYSPEEEKKRKDEELAAIMAPYKKVTEEKTVPFLLENCSTLKEAVDLMGSLGAMLEQHMYRKESAMTVKELGIINDLKRIKPQTESTRKLISLLIPLEPLNYFRVTQMLGNFGRIFEEIAKDRYGKEDIKNLNDLLAK